MHVQACKCGGYIPGVCAKFVCNLISVLGKGCLHTSIRNKILSLLLPSTRKPYIMCWKIFSYDQVQPLNYYSSKFGGSSPCSHGDMSKNMSGFPVLKFCKKLQWTLLHTCTRKSVYSPFIVNLWPCPPSQWLPKRSNRLTRVTANVLMKRTTKQAVLKIISA